MKDENGNNNERKEIKYELMYKTENKKEQFLSEVKALKLKSNTCFISGIMISFPQMGFVHDIFSYLRFNFKKEIFCQTVFNGCITKKKEIIYNNLILSSVCLHYLYIACIKGSRITFPYECSMIFKTV